MFTPQQIYKTLRLRREWEQSNQTELEALNFIAEGEREPKIDVKFLTVPYAQLPNALRESLQEVTK